MLWGLHLWKYKHLGLNIISLVTYCLSSFLVSTYTWQKFVGSHKLAYKDNTISALRGPNEHGPCLSKINLLQWGIRSKSNGVVYESLGNHHGVYESPRKIKTCMFVKAMSGFEKHLKTLDLYLDRLQYEAKKKPCLRSLNQSTEVGKGENLLQARETLVEVKESVIGLAEDFSVKFYANKDKKTGSSRSLKNYIELKTEEKFADDASDFYLIGILVSINIAVFLFGIATPVKNSNFELFSIPMICGAKINSLILSGEWWRLVTPMFLHVGIFHMALGCFGLFTFGLEVSKKYGSFTFLLICLLGGISGNIISFLHTPEITVGGTDPVFALIGAWLIYQVQNKDIITSRDSYEKTFRKALIITALSFGCSFFGHLDDWAHFGAAFTGMAFGFLTCPTLQVKDATSSESGNRRQDERVTLVGRYADPCKSLVYFSLLVLLLSSLLLVMEPPLYLI